MQAMGDRNTKWCKNEIESNPHSTEFHFARLSFEYAIEVLKPRARWSSINCWENTSAAWFRCHKFCTRENGPKLFLKFFITSRSQHTSPDESHESIVILFFDARLLPPSWILESYRSYRSTSAAPISSTLSHSVYFCCCWRLRCLSTMCALSNWQMICMAFCFHQHAVVVFCHIVEIKTSKFGAILWLLRCLGAWKRVCACVCVCCVANDRWTYWSVCGGGVRAHDVSMC